MRPHFKGGMMIGLSVSLHAQGPTPDPLTGHYYEETVDRWTWDAARIEAGKRTFGGQPGHLATVGALRENQIIRFLRGSGERWIGLTHSTSISTLDGYDLRLLGTFEAGNSSSIPLPPEGETSVLGQRGAGFRWVTGEPYTFMNWRNGTPADANGGSDGVYLISQGVWQDVPAGASLGQTRFEPVLRQAAVDTPQPALRTTPHLGLSSVQPGPGSRA